MSNSAFTNTANVVDSTTTTSLTGYFKGNGSLVSAQTVPIPIADGGTANITANAAFNALAPSQTSNSGKFLTTNATDTSWAVVPLPLSYIAGIEMSNDLISPNTVIDLGAGVCRDDTNTVNITQNGFTKILQSSGVWTAGTGNNGLDTGARANSTWYHVFAISTGVAAADDVLISTSASSPTMPTGYLYKRRVGSIRTNGSGNITPFIQEFDDFIWTTPVADVSVTNPGSSAVTRTLTVPTGVRVIANMGVGTYDNGVAGSAASYIYISDLGAVDVVATNTAMNAGLYTATSSSAGACQVFCRTNTSAQLRSRIANSTASTLFFINTLGWRDKRGK